MSLDDNTSFVEVMEPVTIPAEKFCFQKYYQLLALAGLYNNFELILKPYVLHLSR